MNNIRGRILFAFMAFCLLIAPLVIFSYSSLKKIERERVLKEQVALFNINRLKAANKFSQLLDTDTKIDSFYIHGTTKNLHEYRNYFEESKKALLKIRVAGYSNDKVVSKRLENIEIRLGKFQRNVDSVLHLYKKRGFQDFGLEGEMRKFIHRLENGEGITLTENLTLRRREKDFFLRDNIHYAQLLNQESDSIINRMKADLEKNKESLEVLLGYQRTFNAIVNIERQIGNEDSGFLKEVFDLNTNLDIEVKKLYDLVNHNLNLLISSIKSYVVLFFIVTGISAILFSIFFSGHIARPIQKLISDMDALAKKNFEGSMEVRPGINVNEINKLTETYNNLLQQIRLQLSSLNNKNSKLSELNDRLKESEEELKEASRLKDKFFSIISHDLRGHTGNVLSLAKILDNDAALSEKEKDVFIKYLIDSSQNLQLLLDNLLNWAKTQMNDLEISKRSFNINKVIAKNIQLFQDNAFRKDVSLKFNENMAPKAYADKDMVDFVIRNLFSNALKFTEKGDVISVDVEEKEGFLNIQVSDTGVGMTQEQINKLLNSNKEGYSTKGTQNEVGTGLGFSICMDFVKRNGGQIQITSKYRKGSTFLFTVPTSLTKETILS